MNPPTIPGARSGRSAVRSGSPRSGINDQRLSTCSRCRYGIFVGQAVEWSRDPIGLVHTSCPDPGGQPWLG